MQIELSIKMPYFNEQNSNFGLLRTKFYAFFLFSTFLIANLAKTVDSALHMDKNLARFSHLEVQEHLRYPKSVDFNIQVRNRRLRPLVLESVYNISEDTPVDTAFASMTAYASRPGDLYGTNYTFRIAHESDVYRQFSIAPKDGIIRVAKPLDRETIPGYRLRVEVTDKDGQLAEQSIAVNLIDINDNAPYLNDSHLIIWEDEPPGFVGVVTAYDPDGPGNGPPFFMNQTQDSPYLDLIYTRFDNKCCAYENGFLNISSLRKLDREGPQGKVLFVPILTRDSGRPQQEAVRILRIEIGDKNDNPMNDGYSTIHLYNYKGQMPTTAIGRVYVSDLDDWDVVDKDFTLKTTQEHFSVSNDGLITMFKDTPVGTYTLQVSVFDRVRKESATGTVKIVVDYLDEEAIENAGSVRIRGISAEDFLRPLPHGGTSPYERFRAQLARQLGLDDVNVKIYSILPLPGNSMPPYVELFFAVSRPGPGSLQYGPANSAYVSPVLLTGLLERYRDTFEQSLQIDGSSIVWVNVDPCVNERCTGGGCTRLLTPLTQSPTVIMANKTSLVGVNLTVGSTCQCPRRRLGVKCQKDTCHNGGVCHNTDTGFFCECRGAFNNGSRCENRMRTFTSEGFAWMKPIGSCDNITLSLEFMTKSQDAVLIYNGPMRERRRFDNFVPDMLAIQIREGKLEVKVNLGTSSTWMQLNQSKVSDGEWHILDIVASRLRYEVTLDRCSSVQIGHAPSSRQTPPSFLAAAMEASDARTASCKLVSTAAGSNEQLNVDDPLQLGGVASVDGAAFDAGLVKHSLVGCVRNLRVNGELYDLGDQGVVYAENSEVGCSFTSSLCTKDATGRRPSSEPYCFRGECVVSMSGVRRCICETGWHGPNCEQESKWKMFSQSSYVQYSILDHSILSPIYSNVKLLVVPQKIDSGDLVKVRGSTWNQYMRIGFNNKYLEFTYNFGSLQSLGLTGQMDFSSPMTSSSRFNSFLLEVERYGVYSKIGVDGLTSEPYAGYKIGEADEPFWMDPDPQGFFLGAGMAPPSPVDDFQGCVKEFYFNDLYIPVAESDDSAKVLSQNGVSNSCSIFLTCASGKFDCPSPFVCVDFWKGPFCTCPFGIRPQLNALDGTLEGCGGYVEAQYVGVTPSALTVIILSLLALILLITLLVAYSRQRRKIPTNDDHLIGNVCDYKEEGGGEADQGRYDIAPLRKPVFPDQLRGRAPKPPSSNNGSVPMSNLSNKSPADLDAFLHERLRTADEDLLDGFYDEIRTYAVEDDGLSLLSLSSLDSEGSSDDAADWDARLNGWGPRFRTIADAYNYDKSDKKD